MLYGSRESLQWRHNECDGISNHQFHDSLLKRLIRRRSKKTSKLRVTGLCEGNSPVTGEFPAQRVSNAENVSIWWRHHGSNAIRHWGQVVKASSLLTWHIVPELDLNRRGAPRIGPIPLQFWQNMPCLQTAQLATNPCLLLIMTLPKAKAKYRFYRNSMVRICASQRNIAWCMNNRTTGATTVTAGGTVVWYGF